MHWQELRVSREIYILHDFIFSCPLEYEFVRIVYFNLMLSSIISTILLSSLFIR